MRTPSGVSHFAVREDVDTYSSVNDRYKIRICQGIEHCPWPRAVDTGKDEVVVKSEQQPIRFTDGVLRHFDF